MFGVEQCNASCLGIISNIQLNNCFVWSSESAVVLKRKFYSIGPEKDRL